MRPPLLVLASDAQQLRLSAPRLLKATAPVAAAATHESPAGAAQPLNALLEGIAFATVKVILEAEDVATVHARVESCRRDSAKFMASLDTPD